MLNRWLVALSALLLSASSIPAEISTEFALVRETAEYRLEVMTESLTSRIDSDGDTIVSAIFRTLYVEPKKIGQILAYSFIDQVAAPCGYDGVVVLRSVAFDKGGDVVAQHETQTPIRTPPNGDTQVRAVYDALCKDVHTDRLLKGGKPV